MSAVGVTLGTVCAGGILIGVWVAGYLQGRRDEFKRLHHFGLGLQVGLPPSSSTSLSFPLLPVTDEITTDRIVACMTNIGLRPLSLSRKDLIDEFYRRAPDVAEAFFNNPIEEKHP